MRRALPGNKIAILLCLWNALALAQQPPSTTTGLFRITTGQLPRTVVHQEYKAQLQTAGSVAPFKWEVSEGSLPPGLALDPATGEITGIPTTAGEARFTVRVSDTARPPNVAEREFSIGVLGPLSVEWRQPPVVANGGIEGSVALTNGLKEAYDLTLIVVAVNEYGKAFALGYQHFLLPGQLEVREVPFGSTLPRGDYIVHVDAVGEDMARDRIYRARIRTLEPMHVP